MENRLFIFVGIIFCYPLLLNSQNLEEVKKKDVIILNNNDTIKCDIRMINSQNVFLNLDYLNQKGKVKQKEMITSIRKIKSIEVNGSPVIEDDNYKKLLGKLGAEFDNFGCELKDLSYDDVAESPILFLETPLRIDGTPFNSYCGILKKNEQLYFSKKKN